MRIGIDIDGTITDIRSYIFAHGKDYFRGKDPNKRGYEIAEIYNTTIEEEDKFWNKYFLDYMKSANLNKGCKEVIEKLNEKNDIFIITSRVYKNDYKDMMSLDDFHYFTEDYLLKNGITFKKLEYSSDKKKSVKELNLDIMIEDRINNIQSISSICPVIVIDNENNKNVHGNNIYHAKDWNEVLNTIKKILDNKL